MTRKAKHSTRLKLGVWSGLLIVALAGCAHAVIYRLQESAQPAYPVKESFVLLSDTQYAEPFTDYDVRYELGKALIDLPPATTTRFVASFYRNAEAHFAVPLATDAILAREEQQNRSFGMFGGDMAELSCDAEAARMFAVLASHPAIPFIVTIGNHDATFHGSYDTDAIGQSGQGPWDTYSFDLWGHTCARSGGRLTKTGFIRRLLEYYETVWHMDFHKALGLLKPLPDAGSANAADGGAVDAELIDYPLGVPLTGVVHGTAIVNGKTQKEGWDSEFSFRLSAPDSPQSHRQSYFFQRWSRRDVGDPEASLVVTVLDTTDLGSRPVLCDADAKFIQVGLAGGITTAQVDWLEKLQKVRGPHFVLSHYIPFEDIDQVDVCETTLGTHCLGARLAEALAGATYVYAHVHKDFRTEALVPVGASATKPADAGVPFAPAPSVAAQSAGASALAAPFSACRAPGSPPFDASTFPLVRLPSLIDNKEYVVFENGAFSSVKLGACDGSADAGPNSNALASVVPFTMSCDTCTQRWLEFKELERNIGCFIAASKGTGSCPDLTQTLNDALTSAPKLCKDLALAWRADNAAEWANLESDPKFCKGADQSESWRCILKGLAQKAMADAKLTQEEQRQLGLQLLQAVHPLANKDHDCGRPAPVRTQSAKKK